MNKEQNWKDWQPGDETLENILKPGLVKRLHSKNPLAVLRSKLVSTMIWSLVITLGYFILFFYSPSIWVTLSLVVLILFNSYILYLSYLLYKKIDPNISSKTPVLGELKRHYEEFQRWWQIQQRMAIFVYPIAVAGGFIFGGLMSSGKTLEELFQKQVFSIGLVVSIIVLVPVSIWFARWMFNVSFGKHLKVLKENIDSLERD